MPNPAGGQTRWHCIPATEALGVLDSRRAGLMPEEAAGRLNQYGPNALPMAGRGEAFKILLRQVHNPLIYVLLASTGLAMLTGKVLDGLVILGVIVLNALIGFGQEYRASRAIKALSSMNTGRATRQGSSRSTMRRFAAYSIIPLVCMVRRELRLAWF